MMKRKPITPPDVIYLQWPDDGHDAYDEESITWADQEINNSDPKYLRATPGREAAPDLLEACEEALAGLAAHAIGATDSNKENADRNVGEVRRIHSLLKAAIAKAKGL